MNKFLDEVTKLLNEVTNEEYNNIKEAALVMFNSLKENKLVHVFATGHSHMFAEEMFYRSGGLVGINPILEPSLMQHEGAIRSTKLERLSGLAKIIYDSVKKLDKEPFIIVSNSGINSVPVEMAQIAKEDGHPVIVVTSINSSKNSTPRTKTNYRLYEVADIVIDNHVPYADGVFEIDNTKIGAVSSIIGSFISQSLVLEVIKLYKENNLTPPIYQSANTPGGDDHNQKLYETYKNRIKSLY